MSFLARTIARAKWDRREGLAALEIPADAVTVDLRTNDNTLSFWTCGDAREEDVRRVVLAFAAAGQRIDRVDVIWVARSAFEERSIVLRNTEGKTPILVLKGDHVDVKHLDLARFGVVATQVALALREGRYKRFTREEVISLLADAVSADLVALDALQELVQADVSAKLKDR